MKIKHRHYKRFDNEKPHPIPQCGPDNVKCFICVSEQFAFHGTINCSFRSLWRGTARAVGQILDDSVWANKRSTDRPLGGQTRSNVANVVIVIGLIFRCGATRRPTALPPLWLRVSSNSRNRGNKIMLQFSANGCHIGHRRLLFDYVDRGAETGRNDITTRLRAHDVLLIRHFFNYTNFATILSMRGTINTAMREIEINSDLLPRPPVRSKDTMRWWTWLREILRDTTAIRFASKRRRWIVLVRITGARLKVARYCRPYRRFFWFAQSICASMLGKEGSGGARANNCWDA